MNNRILIGSDEGSYTPTNGDRTIIMSGLSFNPTIEQIAYVYNITQDQLYYAPSVGIALCTLTGSTITIDASFPVLATGDKIHIQFWQPIKAGATDTWGIGGWNEYSNAAGDFTATITNGTQNVTIAGLPFTLESQHVVGGVAFKIAVTTNKVSVLPLTNITVSGGVITFGDAVNFATGDVVSLVFRGPTKSYDIALDSTKTIVQNPDYAHYTSSETLIDEADIAGRQATGSTGSTVTTIIDASGAFTVASTAVGYLAYNIIESQSATVMSVDSTTQITTSTGVTSWSGDTYVLPLVKRYEISMESYNKLSVHYYLRNGASLNTYLKIYGTNNSSANADSDTGWIDMSTDLFGDAAGINCAASTTVENIKFVTTKIPILKFMIKLVVECSVFSGQDNDYEVYTIKSY